MDIKNIEGGDPSTKVFPRVGLGVTLFYFESRHEMSRFNPTLNLGMPSYEGTIVDGFVEAGWYEGKITALDHEAKTVEIRFIPISKLIERFSARLEVLAAVTYDADQLLRALVEISTKKP